MRPRKSEAALGVTTAAAGVLMTCAPAWVSRTVAGGRPMPPPAIVRTLGIRYLCQALVQLFLPRRAAFTAGATVDALHVASMIPVAAAMTRYRRPAVCSLVLATVSIAANSAVAAQASR
jgi:hypothetical protein